jgi:hypothetical protein
MTDTVTLQVSPKGLFCTFFTLSACTVSLQYHEDFRLSNPQTAKRTDGEAAGHLAQSRVGKARRQKDLSSKGPLVACDCSPTPGILDSPFGRPMPGPAQ